MRTPVAGLVGVGGFGPRACRYTLMGEGTLDWMMSLTPPSGDGSLTYANHGTPTLDSDVLDISSLLSYYSPSTGAGSRRGNK